MFRGFPRFNERIQLPGEDVHRLAGRVE